MKKRELLILEQNAPQKQKFGCKDTYLRLEAKKISIGDIVKEYVFLVKK